MPPLPVRLLIVASDLLARSGLAGLLRSATELEVIAQAAPTGDLATLIAVYQPQVVLWDFGWNTDQEVDLLADLTPGDSPLEPEAYPDAVRIVALVASEASARSLWDAGVRAILLRSTPLPRLIAAISAAAEGLIIVDEQLFALFTRLSPLDDQPLEEPLTPRELEVLQLLAQGMANKTIARTLAISEHTVKFHVNAILAKLGAQSRTDAVVRASRAGLVIL
jgi:DNA-binding NarL/FixJ family response regulator